MKTHAKSSDEALAALALVEAVKNCATSDVRNIYSTTPTVDLLAGMTTLVSSLTVSLAAATGVGPDIITDHLRQLLHTHALLEDPS